MLLAAAISLCQLDAIQYQNLYYGVLTLAILAIILVLAYLLIGSEKEEED